MELNFLSRALLVSLLLAIVSSFSSSTVISDGVLESQDLVIGRNLLQAKKKCSLNLEFMNYTIITSQCKGPKFPAKECCSSFLDFACPYADQLNDQCHGNKIGLECPDMPPSSAADVNTATATTASSRIWMTAALFVTVLLFRGRESHM